MIKALESLNNLVYPVVTMGTFDGVHIGHQKLLQTVISRAKKKEGNSVVITYYHHPKEVLTESLTPYLLTEKSRKTELLKQLGIEHIIYLQFDRQMAQMKAEQFLKEILIDQVGMKEIVFGYDCHFGHEREGDYHFLKNHEKLYNYHSYTIKPVKIDKKIVSSSLIRNLLREGQVSRVKQYLGRFYDLEGTVATGDGIGHKIGFPTLNILPADPYKLIPANGVYFGQAILPEGRSFFCLTNIGFCPTLKQLGERTVESFLIGYEGGELYGQRINVSFISRLRNEIEFSDREALIRAIDKDLEIAEKMIEDFHKGQKSG